MPGRSSARYVAPLALVAFLIVFIVVVSSSGGGGSSHASKAKPAATAAQPAARPRRPRKYYTVKPNDLLSTISTKTGVDSQRIQQLNPDLDPQALVPGERIKLR